ELDDGIQVEVTPPADNVKPGDKVVVELKDKDGNPDLDGDGNPVKVEKDIPEGWTPGNPIEVTIPKDKLPTDEDGKVKDGDYTVVGKIEDPAGNVSKETDAPISIDTGVPGDKDGDGVADDKGKPIVSIQDGGDDKLNGTEVTDGQAKATITFPENAGYEAGDTLTVTNPDGTTQTFTLTDSDIANGKEITFPVTEGEENVVKAKVTDPAGNSSLEGEDKATVDTQAPSAPTSVEIGNGDEFITPTEITDGKVPVKVGLPDDAKVGDKVVVTPEGGEPVEKVLTPDDITAGEVTLDVPAPNEGEKLKVDAKVVDEAGNEGTPLTDEATRDTKVPGDSDNDGQPDAEGQPVVAIQDGGDEKLNGTEVTDGKAKATITFPENAGYEAGDTLTVTNPDGSTQTFTLTDSDIANGKEITFPVTEGEENVVKAKVTDPAGNSSLEGEDKATVDTLAPNAPKSVEIGNGDEFITPTEITDGKVPVKVGLPDDAKVGDKVVVTPEGGQPVEHVLTGDDITAGKVTVNVPAPNEGEKLKVDAKVVDEAGNKSAPLTDEATRDTKVPGDSDNDGQPDENGQPVVTIQDGGDDKLNGTEVTDGKAKATITFPENAGYEAGDTLTVTNPDGSTQTFTLTDSDIANGKEITFPVKEGEENVVKAKVTDPAGNSSLEGEDKATVDTQAPSAPTSVEIGNGDDFITPGEITDGKVPVKVGLPDDAKVGDKVVVTPEGGEPVEKELTPEDITAGEVTVDVPAPNEGEKLKVDAKVVDEAGNEGTPLTDEATRDTQAPDSSTTTITVDTVAGADNKIDPTEAKQATQAVTGKVTGEFKAGDAIVIKVGDEVIGNGTVNADGTFSVDVPTEKLTGAADKKVTATITATDPAGNTGDITSAEKPYEVDLGRTAPTVTIGTAENKLAGSDVEYIVKSEITTEGTGESAVEKVSVSVEIPTDAKAGDTLTLTTNTDSAPITYTVKAEDIGTTITQSVTAPTDGEKLEVSATITSVTDTTVVSDPGTAEATRDTSAKIGITIGEKPFFKEHLDSEQGSYGVIRVSDDLQTQYNVSYGSGGTVSESAIGELPLVLHSGEVNKDGEFRTTFTLPTDAKVGETLRYTITTDGEGDEKIVKEGTHTLTQADLDEGKVYVMAKAPELQMRNVVVEATLTDLLGNEGEQTAQAIRARFPYSSSNTDSADLAAQISLSVSGSTVTQAADGSTVQAAQEGVDGSKLTYTLNLSVSAASDYKVAVKLNVAGTTVDINDYTVEGAEFYPEGLTGDRTTTAPHVIVTVPKGAKTASFTITPKDDNTQEGTEYINAELSKDVYNYGSTEAHKASGKFYGYSEQDSAKAAILDAVPPKVSIAVTGDITEDVLYPATAEDKSSTTVLTYTVSLDQAKATDTVVKVALTGKATPNTDYTIKVGDNTVTGEDHSQTLGEGEGAETLTGKVIEVTIPAGQTSATFTIDPISEENADTFNFEGPENVIATIQASADNKYTVAELNEATNSGERAIGLILDANPVALPHLNGDFSLAYGTSSSWFEKNINANEARTVSTIPGKYTYKAGAITRVDTGDAMTTTDRDDQLYIGYYSNGAASSTAGNFANFSDVGGARLQTDNGASYSTIDMGKGNDVLMVRGMQRTLGDSQTNVYLGEGDDTYELGGNFGETKVEGSKAVIFAEADNDTISIGGHSNGNLYAGSGSDTVTIDGIANGIIDLGSGRTMPDRYLATYLDGRSLGNDNNTDLATDANILVIKGTGILAGTGHTSEIYGGAGDDSVTIAKGSYVSEMNLGDGNNVVIIQDSLGILANGGSITTGAGNDHITIQGNIVGNSKVETGAGDDTLLVGENFNGGEGNDTLTVTGAGRTINFAGILNVETIDLNGSGANTLTNVLADNVNKSTPGSIYIKGGADDKVNIGTQNLLGTNLKEGSKTWSKGATVEKDGVSYDTWSDGSAMIYIQEGVQVI
ncbi:hypothetical protein BKG92_01220, partial [Rodentibacter ratti]